MAAHYHGGDHGLAADYAGSLLYQDDQQVPLRLTGWLSRRLSMQIVMARILWMQGQGERAVRLAADCVRDGEEARFPAALSQALCLAALPVALWQGDDARARALLRQLEAHLACHPQQYWAPWLTELQLLLALRAAPAGQLAGLPGTADAKLLDHLASFGARSHHEQALARWRHGMVGWTGPELLRMDGERLLREDPADAAGAAEATIREALALATRQGAHAWALRACNSLAKLRLAQERAGDARILLLPWLDRLAPMGDSADAAETRALLERCR
jgi:hypothetical protein